MKNNVLNIIKRLKVLLNCGTDTQLAEVLGIGQNAISAWKKRGSVNYSLILKYIKADDIRWLVYGDEDGNSTINDKSVRYSTKKEVDVFDENVDKVFELMKENEVLKRRVIELVKKNKILWELVLKDKELFNGDELKEMGIG